MLRTTILRAARPSFAVSRAAFTTTARALGAGDTGAPPKTGGFGYVIAPRSASGTSLRCSDRQTPPPYIQGITTTTTS